MNIVVPVKLVPDLVEELEIAEGGAALDTTFMRLILNELDEHAIEQAILLKERGGGQVTVVTAHVEGADDALYAAAAKGADRLAPVIRGLQPDLVLTGVQAHDDLDGSVGPLLAECLGMPYIGYVAGVTVADGRCTARKEYPGGLIAEMEVILPAVLGIQASESPPRYVAVSKVRQAMKTATIEEKAVDALDAGGGPTVSRMFRPETGERATMIAGDVEEIAARLVGIFKELGVL